MLVALRMRLLFLPDAVEVVERRGFLLLLGLLLAPVLLGVFRYDALGFRVAPVHAYEGLKSVHYFIGLSFPEWLICSHDHNVNAHYTRTAHGVKLTAVL